MKFLYLNTRFYLALLIVTILFAIGFFAPFFFYVALIVLAVIVALIAVEIFLLFHKKDGITVERIVPERLSNGDKNEINLNIKIQMRFKKHGELHVRRQITLRHSRVKLP